MLNQVVIVGRLINEPKLEEKEKGKESVITLVMPRGFKNKEGVYETDYIDVTLLDSIAEHVYEYCKKNDLIGVKGSVRKLSSDTEMKIVAEKITFLSTGKKEDL